MGLQVLEDRDEMPTRHSGHTDHELHCFALVLLAVVTIAVPCCITIKQVTVTSVVATMLLAHSDQAETCWSRHLGSSRKHPGALGKRDFVFKVCSAKGFRISGGAIAFGAPALIMITCPNRVEQGEGLQLHEAFSCSPPSP